jgi:hypothetical protein
MVYHYFNLKVFFHSDGCCVQNEKCVAIKSHEVKLQKVGIITFEGENNGRYDEKMVSVSNHTECQCQCQWETVNIFLYFLSLYSFHYCILNDD